MRILFTTRGSSGHVGPLAPFAHACMRAGHEVMVSAQRHHQGNVERLGLPAATVDDPPAEEWMPLMGEFAELDVATAHGIMITEFFARIDVRAGLPGLRSTIEEWRPDVIVRESWEFASALIAESLGIPLVRVGLGVEAVEEETIRLASTALGDARAELGLPPDQTGDRLRDTPYFTMLPEALEALEAPGAPVSPLTRRFRPEAADGERSLGDWWPGNEAPLVYLTLGSVTAGAHLPYYPALYKAAIEALATLPVRVLVTIGEDRDRRELGAVPPNIHVERWVPQDAVGPQAAVIVCHGGYGSTLGALAHGVPLVVLPLFSGDQWANADAVARAGAGVALLADRTTRCVLGLPDADTLGELPGAVERVLADAAYRREAGRIADATRALPPVEAAVHTLAAVGAGAGL